MHGREWRSESGALEVADAIPAVAATAPVARGRRADSAPVIRSLMQMALQVAWEAVDTARRARANRFDLGGHVPPQPAAFLLAGCLAEACPQLSSVPPGVCEAVQTMTTMLDASFVCI